MSYRLGVDLGTTFTAAASVTDGDPPIMVGLGNRSLQIPSVLFMQADGNTLVGEPARFALALVIAGPAAIPAVSHVFRVQGRIRPAVSRSKRLLRRVLAVRRDAH